MYFVARQVKPQVSYCSTDHICGPQVKLCGENRDKGNEPTYSPSSEPPTHHDSIAKPPTLLPVPTPNKSTDLCGETKEASQPSNHPPNHQHTHHDLRTNQTYNLVPSTYGVREVMLADQWTHHLPNHQHSLIHAAIPPPPLPRQNPLYSGTVPTLTEVPTPKALYL